MSAEDITITLRAMSFHTLIGVLPHEREHPQPIEVDLTAWVRDRESVLDYRRLYAAVRKSIDASAISYLEDLAESIAANALDERAVRKVRVAIRKPHAAIGGPLAYAEVALERSRDA